MSLYPKEGNSDWFPREIPKPHPLIPSHEPLPPIPRNCNRHKDCDEADMRAKEKYDKLQPWEQIRMLATADHCHDEDCEDCFGK